MPADNTQSKQEQVLQLIREERSRQDFKWGGPEHDRSHYAWDWMVYIQKHSGRAAAAIMAANNSRTLSKKWRGQLACRAALVKVAALCVAALEHAPDLHLEEEEAPDAS